jgi:hypothetical protein
MGNGGVYAYKQRHRGLLAGARSAKKQRHVTPPPGLSLWAGCLTQFFPVILKKGATHGRAIQITA